VLYGCDAILVFNKMCIFFFFNVELNSFILVDDKIELISYELES